MRRSSKRWEVMATKETRRRLVFEVDDKGTLRLVEGKLDRVNTKAKNLGKSTGELDRNMKGVAGATNNTTKSFAKQAQGMGGLVHIYATVAAHVFALSSAYLVLKRSADLEIMKKAAEDLSVSTGRNFAKVAEDMKKLTGGALNFADAMRVANLGLSGGATANQLERITLVATKAANSLGRSVPESVQRMVQAVTKSEPELVDEFGIILRVEEATKKYAKTVGKTRAELTTFEKQQAIINQLLEQGEERYGGVEAAINPYEKLGATFLELSDTILAFISGPLGTLVGYIANNTPVIIAIIASLVKYIGTKALPIFKDFGTVVGASFTKAQLAISTFSKRSTVAFSQLSSALTAQLANTVATKGRQVVQILDEVLTKEGKKSQAYKTLINLPPDKVVEHIKKSGLVTRIANFLNTGIGKGLFKGISPEDKAVKESFGRVADIASKAISTEKYAKLGEKTGSVFVSGLNKGLLGINTVLQGTFARVQDLFDGLALGYSKLNKGINANIKVVNTANAQYTNIADRLGIAASAAVGYASIMGDVAEGQDKVTGVFEKFKLQATDTFNKIIGRGNQSAITFKESTKFGRIFGGSLRLVGAAAGFAAKGIALLFGPVGIFLTILLSILPLLGQFTDFLGLTSKESSQFSEAIDATSDSLKKLENRFENLAEKRKDFAQVNSARIFEYQSGIADELSDSLDDLTNSYRLFIREQAIFDFDKTEDYRESLEKIANKMVLLGVDANKVGNILDNVASAKTSASLIKYGKELTKLNKSFSTSQKNQKANIDAFTDSIKKVEDSLKGFTDQFITKTPFDSLSTSVEILRDKFEQVIKDGNLVKIREELEKVGQLGILNTKIDQYNNQIDNIQSMLTGGRQLLTEDLANQGFDEKLIKKYLDSDIQSLRVILGREVAKQEVLGGVFGDENKVQLLRTIIARLEQEKGLRASISEIQAKLIEEGEEGLAKSLNSISNLSAKYRELSVTISRTAEAAKSFASVGSVPVAVQSHIDETKLKATREQLELNLSVATIVEKQERQIDPDSEKAKKAAQAVLSLKQKIATTDREIYNIGSNHYAILNENETLTGRIVSFSEAWKAKQTDINYLAKQYNGYNTDAILWLNNRLLHQEYLNKETQVEYDISVSQLKLDSKKATAQATIDNNYASILDKLEASKSLIITETSSYKNQLALFEEKRKKITEHAAVAEQPKMLAELELEAVIAQVAHKQRLLELEKQRFEIAKKNATVVDVFSGELFGKEMVRVSKEFRRNLVDPITRAAEVITSATDSFTDSLIDALGTGDKDVKVAKAFSESLRTGLLDTLKEQMKANTRDLFSGIFGEKEQTIQERQLSAAEETAKYTKKMAEVLGAKAPTEASGTPIDAFGNILSIGKKFIDSASSGSGSDFLSNALNIGSEFKEFFEFADGGVVHKPTAAIVGEGANSEAIIPMPNNRAVPVEFTGEKESTAEPIVISQNFDFTGAQPGAEARLRAEAARIKQETFQAVFDAMDRGGKFAKKAGRR